MKKQFSNIFSWMKDRFRKIPERDHYIIYWIIGFGLATTLTTIIVAIGRPTGPTLLDHTLNISKLVAVNGLLFFVCLIIVSALFSFIYLPLPRLLAASFSYTAVSSVLILWNTSSGTLFSYIVGIGYSVVVMLVIAIIILLIQQHIHKKIKIVLLSAIIILTAGGFLLLNSQTEEPPQIAGYNEDVTDEDPSQQGKYDYTFFTYGSGFDLHREKFGEAVDEQTPSVNASHFITNWGEDRTEFWGFDQEELPVNGRTWLPEGDGPFPIILMTHGNHTMEYFSTSGYDYLGELLASRGFIAISVDEDFINYSNILGSPNDNYELRAWMILKHLAQLQEMNASSQSVFNEKINFDQVALMGHSRGGQAGLMAADYQNFFEDTDILDSMKTVNVEGVIAVAPTDKTIDDKHPQIHNTSFLLIHGAKDADVSDFRRDKQFYHATFDGHYDGFKSSLYIGEANHTQFNTDWGRMDLSYPRGLFLNTSQIMPAEDQQQIAKVYISAFMESIFHDHTSYEKLFQNYQYGQNWLPNATLINKYQHASYEPIKTFANPNETKLTSGFTDVEVVTPEHRRGHNRLHDSLRLEWNDDAVYDIQVANMHLPQSERIVLTMANIDHEAEKEHVPEIDFELEMMNGNTAAITINDIMPFPPVISTDFTHFGLFDSIFRGGRYETSWEPVFQTFDIPFDLLTDQLPNFNSNQIKQISLHFKSEQPGKILIEEIGMY